jgi:ribosomal-protein-alanine N-acetyltransferase
MKDTGSCLEGYTLRRGMTEDLAAISRLLAFSRWVYWPPGREEPTELLEREPSLVWLRGLGLRGVFLVGLRRRPVAMARLLILQHRDELTFFARTILPRMEAELAGMGIGWLGFVHCPPWLASILAAQGYGIQDRVVGYRLAPPAAQEEGNAQVVIRPAVAQEMPAILALDAAIFAPFWRLNQEIIAEFLSLAPGVLVAEEDGALRGYLAAQRQGYATVFISRLGVHPLHQGRGIGRRLLAEALAQWRAAGIKEVYLNTQEDNLRARRFYERMGFAPTGEGETYWAKSLALHLLP